MPWFVLTTQGMKPRRLSNAEIVEQHSNHKGFHINYYVTLKLYSNVHHIIEFDICYWTFTGCVWSLDKSSSHIDHKTHLMLQRCRRYILQLLARTGIWSFNWLMPSVSWTEYQTSLYLDFINREDKEYMCTLELCLSIFIWYCSRPV